jgi:hypothetical protein
MPERIGKLGSTTVIVRSISPLTQRRMYSFTCKGRPLYEGNVLIWVIDGEGASTVAHTQAERAGPERGDWEISVQTRGSSVRVVVGQAEMEESRNSELRRVVLPI